MADSSPLTAEQKYALLDILTHDRTYREIEEFKSQETIQKYGPPFQDDLKPITPILQRLVTKCAVTLPGLRDVAPDFWKVRVQTLVGDLSAADLSESYDKGNLGIRKTLSTAVSSLIEYPARGMLGGFPKDESAFHDKKYNPKDPEDVLLAWQHFLQRLVYSDYFDVLYRRAAETDKLADHDTLLQSAHEFIIVNLASFMHYTLILSPEGPSVVRLIESVNKLAPYGLMRQTLRVGNVATMINGMMKLVLAKMSIGSLTNWIGVSSGADEGMNLLQQIISTILGWDKREFKKRLDKIDKHKNGPSPEAKEAIRKWIYDQDKHEHLQTREMSKQNKMSMVQTILSLSSTDPEMSEEQHNQALQYLSLHLSIRDRDQITKVLCRSNPDHLTQGIREAVAAYEPLIRQVHQAVDLSETVSDFQAFVNDMLKLCKLEKPVAGHEAVVPSVEDFVDLLHRHQHASHKFLHQVTKNGIEISNWFREWCHDTAANFRREGTDKAEQTSVLEKMASVFAELPKDKQDPVRQELDAHTDYLKKIHEGSAARIREVVQNDAARQKSNDTADGTSTPSPSVSSHKDSKSAQASRRTMYGPGGYLAKWQNLLDATDITPSKAFGPIRHGSDISVMEESSKDVDGGVHDVGVDTKEKQELAKVAKPSKTDETLEALGPRFRAMLRGEE
ncbi:hypothetical protein K461DRAFT_322373 [Myriangium duriaei CBS 260.36]|uniref:PX domain-containing protein n=1 Tax=Myriangium duriaei CBS 260.36 TaxID=1168546 RepID=A0A9P4J0I1_9PEZI|nr:hypothetical protein K461DRAFT_322373 [Myriangium duriaei CBS 260.36]